MVRFVWRDPYAEADDLAWTWERLTPANADDARAAGRAAPSDGIAEHHHLVRAAAVPLFSGLADEAAPPKAPSTPPPLSPIPEARHAHAHAPRPRHPEGPVTGTGELAGGRP
jgi:hypothetical protein